jgi:hypothetical protein
MIRRLGPKRFVLLLLAGGYVALFIDAYIGHEVTGGGISNPAQYLPLGFSPLAALVCAFLGLKRVSERLLAWVTGVVGSVSAVMGAVGVGLHLYPVLLDLQNEEVTWAAFLGALGSAPPLLAPAAFLAVGLMLIAVGARRVRISIQTPGAPGGNDTASGHHDRTAAGEQTAKHRAA